MYSIVNTFFDKGYQLPVSDKFFYTLNSVSITHMNGYIRIEAKPNFEKIDVISILNDALAS